MAGSGQPRGTPTSTTANPGLPETLLLPSTAQLGHPVFPVTTKVANSAALAAESLTALGPVSSVDELWSPGLFFLAPDPMISLTSHFQMLL